MAQSYTLADVYDVFNIYKSAIESINQGSMFNSFVKGSSLSVSDMNLLDVREKMTIIDKAISYYEKFGNFVYNMNTLKEILENLGTVVNSQIDDFQSQSSMVTPF